MTDPGSRFAEVTIKIPFHDLDPVGIVWHGNYARYFEVARCALLETFDYNYDQMFASGFSWPIIDLQTRFMQSAKFGQEIIVRASLVEWEYRLRISYAVRDALTGRRIAKGRSDQVAVELKSQEMCLRSPHILFDKLGVHP